MTNIEKTLAAVDAGLDRSIDKLFELMRIASVSSDPAYAEDCRRAGDWLVAELHQLGFTAKAHATPGHPVVIGHYRRARTAAVPRILFYGHYDVQPPDPIEEWLTPPFEPRRIKGADGIERIYGRGAADDKGQLWTFIEACRAFLATEGTLPVDITILLEGEEESGSPSLPQFLERVRQELESDVALVCDSDMWDARTPAITIGLKGLLHEKVTVHGPSRDLHSGIYGPAAANPLRILAKMLAALHDASGRVTVPGFYDGVRRMSKTTLEQWEGLNFRGAAFLGDVGLSDSMGEADCSLLEQLWARPTIDFNGLQGGNAGPGERSVLPATATARLSFRLVDGQDSEIIRNRFRNYVRTFIPRDCSVEFEGSPGSAAIAIAEDNDFLLRTAKALSEEWGHKTVLKGSGGAIPAVRYLKDIVGVDSILAGFSLADDAIHAPNEKYNVESFHKGVRSWVRVLAELARSPSPS